MNLETNNVYKLPVSYGREENVVTSAFVDQELLPYLAKFKWFLSDPRRPKTPKTQMRIKGVPKSMLLNRVVYTLDGMNDEQRAKVTERINIKFFYDLVCQQPKLKFKRHDPFDCRMENIEVCMVGVNDAAIAEHDEFDSDDSFTASMIEDQEAKELQEALAKRNEDLKRRKFIEETLRKSVPDGIEISSEHDPLGLMKEISPETIEKSKAEQDELMGQLFGLMDNQTDKSPPSKPPL
jgi:hypothetical protein